VNVTAIADVRTSPYSRLYPQFNRDDLRHELRSDGISNSAGSAARLLYVYFCGDAEDPGRTCPASEANWTAELAKQDKHIGLPAGHLLESRMHKLFLECSVP
jgi:hypothetical protein